MHKKYPKVLNRLVVTFFLLLFGMITHGQTARLNITMLSQKVNPGDTVSFDASFLFNDKPPATASLFLKAVNNTGKVWNMRWPLFEGMCQVDIAIPDSFKSGKLTLYFAASTQFFSLHGHISSPGKVQKLKSTLMTAGQEWLTEDIPVTPEGNFLYRNKVFEGDATLFLKKEKGDSDDLDISIISALDSAFTPQATVIKELIIGNPTDTVNSKRPGSFVEVDRVIASNEKMLETVVVTAKKLSKAEQFSEKYSTGLFKSMNERVLDLIDDPFAISSMDVLNYIQGRVAGLQVSNPMSPEPSVSWRNSGVTFYIDEMRTDVQVVKSIPMADIAIIKAYPPPFFGNSMGDGGAIAIYTKRGEFQGNGKRRNFRIKGYTPYVSTLPVIPNN